MREPIVSIVRCRNQRWDESVLPAVREALDLIGGLETVISRGDIVLLKPNLISPRTYETGATTNPALVRALVKLCKEAGARRVIVGEGSAVGYDTDEAFECSGLRELVAQRVEVVDFKKGDFQWVTIPNGIIFKRLRIPRTVLEANIIINLPVMKTHDALPVTLGLKNMKGVIHESDKKRFHKWGLDQAIVDLNKLVLPELTVLDGTVGMEGLGPNSGTPVGLGLILASTETVALDTVATKIMGFEPEEVRHIQLAQAQGLGCADLTRIEVVGCTIEEVRRPFKRIQLNSERYAQWGIRIVERGACSGCQHFLEAIVTKWEQRGGLEALRGSTLVYGQTVQPPEEHEGELLLIGSCTRRFKDRGRYLPGCPPHPLDFRAFLGL